MLIQRFVGSTTESSSLPNLLRSIAVQICKAYGVEEEKDRVLRLPLDSRIISAALDDLLHHLPTAAAPLLIMLDNIGALSQTEGAASVRWIPTKVSTPISCV